jgi:Domain of unknown function (DUF4328)/Septum formation
MESAPGHRPRRDGQRDMDAPPPPPARPGRTSTWAPPAPANAPLPPPPLVPSPPTGPPVRPYRSPRGLATVVRWLFVASILLAGADAAANAQAARLLGRLRTDANLVSPSMLEASDLRVGAAALLDVLVFLTAFGFLIAWTNRAYRNLPALGANDPRFTPGWAVGGWFVPFLNFVRPKQIMDDIWRGSSPEDYAGDDWRGRSVTPLLHWWWGLWIVGGLLSYSSFSATTDPSAAQADAIRTCVADVVLAIGSALAIVIVTRLTERQEQRAFGVTPTSQASRWEHAVWIAPILAVVVFGAAFVGFAAVDDTSTDEDRRAGTSPTSEPVTRSVMALDLALGDCFEDPPGWSDSTEEVTEVLAVNVVPCTESHDEEVVGQIRYPADADDPFPGEDEVIGHAEVECLDAFERWVGRPYLESSLELGYLWPQAEGWDLGDRTILCLAYRPGGRQLVGTVRDTAM